MTNSLYRLPPVSWSCLLILLVAVLTASAAEPAPAAIGVTRQGQPIPVLLAEDAYQLKSPRKRVLVVAGLDQQPASTTAAQKLVEWYERDPKAAELRKSVSLSVIPQLFPAGMSAASVPAVFPPANRYYDDPEAPEIRYLWRWIALYGADFVIDLRSGNAFSAEFAGPGADVVAAAVRDLAEAREVAAKDGDLLRELARGTAGDAGAVPAIRLVTTAQDPLAGVPALFGKISQAPQSPNHQELLRRQERTPAQLATELAPHYGGSLKQVAYIPALGVLGREITARRDGTAPMLASVAGSLAPYREGQVTPKPKSGSEQAGHLIFAELAKRSAGAERERWIVLCRAAADQIFDESGKPKAPMPFHNEMSDAFFMATPIVCATGALTGEEKYFAAALGHFRAMEKLCLRDDGIYRHSPLDQAAWGRGNGFAALGTSLSLCELPADHPARAELLAAHLRHLRALRKHQDAGGAWRQVIDHPESYREFTSTCMISFALVRGIERGWLAEEEFAPAARRAWQAIQLRVGPAGRLVDVCTGTGKMKSLRDYYDRPAILGNDDRGGAMGLLIANEWAAARKLRWTNLQEGQ